MKRILFAIVLVILLSSISVRAMETLTYTETATGTNTATEIYFTTLRYGSITIHATFPLSNHGIYQLNIEQVQSDGSLLDVCRKTLDARWGRATSGDMICAVSNQPAGIYTVEFISNRRVTFTVQVSAEMNP